MRIIRIAKTNFKNNPKHYILSCVGLFFVGVLSGICYQILYSVIQNDVAVGVIPIIIITGIICTYSFYVFSYIVAKIAKQG